jgi:hypothetical protein
MSPVRRTLASLALATILLITGLGAFRAVAQAPVPGITFQDLGTVDVTGTDWIFSGDFQIHAGAWESVTISNYGYCFVGPNDPREGTAHAAGVYWFAELSPDGPGAPNFSGNLMPGRGGNVSGQVSVSTPSDGVTHIDARLSGSDLNFFKDNKLQVCLLGSS